MDESPKHSLFESFTRLALPIIATGAAVASLFKQQRAIALGAVAVALLSLLISEAPRARRAFKERKLRRKQQAVSATAFEDLKGYIHNFEAFANTRRSDALYSIVFGKLCQCNQANYDNLHLAPPMLVCEFWEHLRNRADAAQPSFATLGATILEFNSLVGNYCRYLACPLYECVPSKLSPEMLKVYIYQGVERDLIQFRERFVRFIADYEDFLKDTDRKLPRPLNLGYYFEAPKPVTVISDQGRASLSVR
jgi:hypothetical protein